MRRSLNLSGRAWGGVQKWPKNCIHFDMHFVFFYKNFQMRKLSNKFLTIHSFGERGSCSPVSHVTMPLAMIGLLCLLLKGVFVSFVHTNSPAALVGLRFGDQILQINGENVAGWDTDKVFKVLKKTAPERITMAIRDRLILIVAAAAVVAWWHNSRMFDL